MAYYKVCPHCGTRLDLGEVCDCRKDRMRQAYDLILKMSDEQLDRIIQEWETVLVELNPHCFKASCSVSVEVSAFQMQLLQTLYNWIWGIPTVQFWTVLIYQRAGKCRNYSPQFWGQLTFLAF